jgi:hypothetical protein
MRTVPCHHTKVVAHAAAPFWKEYLFFGAVALGGLGILAVQTIFLA